MVTHDVSIKIVHRPPQGDLIHHQNWLIAIALQGGDIERHTDEQAERVASLLATEAVSSWRCKNWNHDGGGAALGWHITSTDINEKTIRGIS